MTIAAAPPAAPPRNWSDLVPLMLAGENDDSVSLMICVCNAAASVDDAYPLAWWQHMGVEIGRGLDLAIYWRSEPVPAIVRDFALRAAMLADFATGLERIGGHQ